MGMGCISRPRLSRDRQSRGRETCRHRRGFALWESRATDNGPRQALRPGARWFFRRRRRKTTSPKFWGSRRKSHRLRRIPLDGRQLPEVWRRGSYFWQQKRWRPARGRARTHRLVRATLDQGDEFVRVHGQVASALCAPRLTFISYGVPEKGDAKWLDQQGSYMATVAAERVF